MGVQVQQRELLVQADQLLVVERRVAAREPQLVEREALAHVDRERARHDLEVEPAAVAGLDLVEAVVAVRDHPREDVEAAGRALRVRLRPDVRGQVEPLDERDQVRPVALEGRAVAQVDPLEGDLVELGLHGGLGVGQEAAAQRPGELAEAQVEAGRLDRVREDPVVARADPAVGDRLAQLLRGQHPARRPRCRDRRLGLVFALGSAAWSANHPQPPTPDGPAADIEPANCASSA